MCYILYKLGVVYYDMSTHMLEDPTVCTLHFYNSANIHRRIRTTSHIDLELHEFDLGNNCIHDML